VVRGHTVWPQSITELWRVQNVSWAARGAESGLPLGSRLVPSLSPGARRLLREPSGFLAGTLLPVGRASPLSGGRAGESASHSL